MTISVAPGPLPSLLANMFTIFLITASKYEIASRVWRNARGV
jgi:hypothetical protein